MTREECEKRLTEIFKDARDVYHEYYPEGEYLHVSFCDNCIAFNNAYFANDSQMPIKAWIDKDDEFHTMEG